MRGVFALQSEKDPQAVTMRFASGRVDLARGVASDAQVVVTVDLDNMSGPDAAKPKVHGALRHPQFALGVSKLLDAKPRPWPELARAFWEFARTDRHAPAGLRVVCLDNGTTLELGDVSDRETSYELHGTEVALTSVFSGSSVLGQDLLEGKVFGIGSMKYASVLTGSSIAWMMRGPA